MNFSRNKHAMRRPRRRVGRAAIAAVAAVGLTVAGLATVASLSPGFAETANLDAAQQSMTSGRVGQQKSSDQQCGTQRHKDGSVKKKADGTPDYSGGSNGSSQFLTTPTRNGTTIFHWSNCNSSATTFVVRDAKSSKAKTVCVSAHKDKIVAEQPAGDKPPSIESINSISKRTCGAGDESRPVHHPVQPVHNSASGCTSGPYYVTKNSPNNLRDNGESDLWWQNCTSSSIDVYYTYPDRPPHTIPRCVPPHTYKKIAPYSPSSNDPHKTLGRAKVTHHVTPASQPC